MTDLLLITDVPRLRKIFSRLADKRDIRLRVANNLEKGAEELAAEKPAIVFVQTHLSGLSSEIILMHLKKQLGRRRSRFVLLSAPAEVGKETLKLYQGHIDTTQDDELLLVCIKEVISSLLVKNTRKSDPEMTPEPVPTDTPAASDPPEPENIPVIAALQQAADPSSSTTPPEEPSLVEQGITYAPRPRMSVYSEFNTSFDSAVSGMKPAAALEDTLPEPRHDWDSHEIETIEPASARSKRTVFLLWLAPVVIAVIVVTMLQHSRSTPTTSGSAVAPKKPVQPPAGPEHATAAPKQQAETTAAAPVQALPPTAAPDSALSDKAVLSAIAENRGPKEQGKAGAGNGRLTALPDFIPRSAVDKSYATANPGWERYKGAVTEFKVFREGSSIKAIQTIDRGGNGVPESFMKAALRQVSKNPVFVMESSEKKEGYEIQRGRVAENLKVMYYRDDQGGKLRAFVLTWQ